MAYKTFGDLTREAGLDPVLCPYCGRKVSTKKALVLLFRAIVERLRTKHDVRIPSFGTFKTRLYKARGITKAAGDRIIVGFEASKPVKKILNTKRGKQK